MRRDLIAYGIAGHASEKRLAKVVLKDIKAAGLKPVMAFWFNGPACGGDIADFVAAAGK